MNTVLKPVLCIVTSNHVKGSTGIPTGFWLSELTHVLEQLEKSGVPYELASVKGGEPPVDKDSLDTSDPVNEHYLNDAEFQHQLKNNNNQGHDLTGLELLQHK